MKSEINNLRILIVEDDLITQLLTKDLLQLWNNTISIDTAENGMEAIEKLKKNNFDLILMDIQMPKMNGYATASYIRTELPPEVRNIPIIAITAKVAAEISAGDEQHLMNGYVSKPFEGDTLFTAIERVVRESRKVA